MANAILYNQGSHPTGALKSGTMSMNVSPSLNVGALKWRNGFENNNMWVIYSDTYSQGQATQGNALPTIWASATFTDAGLVNLINTLPARAGQTPFTNVTAATSWLRGQGVYFLSNQNYPQIITSGLTMMLDAGFSASFPNGTGTTWYDVCGNDKNGTLYNGPTWINSGTTSYLSFDGTNDYISNNDFFTSSYFTTNQSWTITTTINIISAPGNGGVFANQRFQTEPNGGGFGLNLQSSKYCINLTYNDGSGNQTTYEGLVYTNIGFGNIEHITAVYSAETSTVGIYKNGVLIASSTNSNYKWSPRSSGQLNVIGTSSQGGWGNYYPMNIYNMYLHNRALSQSEILQSYYKGPIVTSGLTMALDAGNLVSYSGTGTTWKNLTSNTLNGTLTNGPTYSSDSGGCIVFDGTDDMVRVTNVSPLGTSYDWTTEAWIKWSNVGYTSWMTIIDSGNYGSAANYMMWISSDTSQKVLATYDGGWNYGTIPLSPNTWYHVVLSKREGTSGVQNSPVRFFVNGVFDVQRNYTYIGGYATNDLGVGLTPSNQNYPMNGKIAQAKVYNRALSDAEVQQNFNAQRGRFGI
jgi:hypothetical protein